ncbi:MAG: hypothetical protein RL567_1190 [Bacteroidota bacterium]
MYYLIPFEYLGWDFYVITKLDANAEIWGVTS